MEQRGPALGYKARTGMQRSPCFPSEAASIGYSELPIALIQPQIMSPPSCSLYPVVLKILLEHVQIGFPTFWISRSHHRLQHLHSRWYQKTVLLI